MHYRTEVVASDMIMLDSRNPREASHYSDESHYHQPDNRPPARGQQAKGNFTIGDEDIPF
jgi:single-strand DNA-binding protein